VKQSVERQSVLGKAAVVDWMVVVHPNAQDRRRENRTGLPTPQGSLVHLK